MSNALSLRDQLIAKSKKQQPEAFEFEGLRVAVKIPTITERDAIINAVKSSKTESQTRFAIVQMMLIDPDSQELIFTQEDEAVMCDSTCLGIIDTAYSKIEKYIVGRETDPKQ